MATDLSIHALVIFAVSMVVSILIFCTMRLALNMLYAKSLSKWFLFKRSLENIRAKGLPLIAKYGFLGFVVFVAAPLPGTGVSGGALLSWLMGMKWQTSLVAILPGTIISNVMLTLSVSGIMRGINAVA